MLCSPGVCATAKPKRANRRAKLQSFIAAVGRARNMFATVSSNVIGREGIWRCEVDVGATHTHTHTHTQPHTHTVGQSQYCAAGD